MGRSLTIAATTCVILLAGGCGSVGHKTLTRPGDAAVPASSSSSGASGWQPVRFARAALQIPSSWSVYDLAANPTRCVRFDQHAAYLGHQGPDTTCPAAARGRTEAVQVEPLDGQARSHLLPGGQTQAINGLTAEVQPFSQTTHSVTAAFSTLGVVVTVTWSDHEDVAQQVLHSVRGL